MKKINGKDYVEINNCFIPADMVKEPKPINGPDGIFPIVSEYATKDQEYFILLTLNGNNSLIKKHEITKGLVNQSLAHPREIFRAAIIDNACYVIMVHNHPSGSLEISESDAMTTKRMVEAGKLLGIPVLDHVIISVTGSKSIRREMSNLFD